MNILFFGDIVGRSGREALLQELPLLKEKLHPDLIVVNGENAAGGFGINPQICRDFYQAGVTVITTGNHIWRQREIINYIETDPHLLRPYNYPNPQTPGQGLAKIPLLDNRYAIVVNLMASLFMPDQMNNPFFAMEEILTTYNLKNPEIACILIDFHGEATSEKMAMGHMLDGRVSFVVGTHTHVPTADHQILPNGTAYQTDAGMCGDFDSVIGMQKDIPIARFKGEVPVQSMKPALGVATLCGTFVKLDDQTGLATHIAPIRIGGRLSEIFPETLRN
ncbi:MAG: YmdB family metallophosphoesterase [Alphaproteobacteria bacterium]|nr:YmdB family metallophosphoesterase [Alphaproteobacteria bacterium]